MTAEVPEDGTFNREFLLKISNLADSSDALAKEVPDLAAAVRRNRVTLRIIGAVVALLLLALAGSSYALYEENRTNNELKSTIISVQNLVTSDTRTNDDVLCPLYSAFVASFTPEQRAKQPPETLPFYDRAIASIRKAYATLGCPSGTAP